MTEFAQIMQSLKEAGLFKGIKGKMLSKAKVASITDYVPEKSYRPFEMKQCFSNSVKFQEMARFQTDKVVYYCEGYVSHKNQIPIEHAWVMIGNKIYDPTFEHVLGISLEDMNKEEYFLLKKYTYNEVINNLVKFEKYGPWFHKVA